MVLLIITGTPFRWAIWTARGQQFFIAFRAALVRCAQIQGELITDAIAQDNLSILLQFKLLVRAQNRKILAVNRFLITLRGSNLWCLRGGGSLLLDSCVSRCQISYSWFAVLTIAIFRQFLHESKWTVQKLVRIWAHSCFESPINLFFLEVDNLSFMHDCAHLPVSDGMLGDHFNVE